MLNYSVVLNFKLDALSYDFFPLQGLSNEDSGNVTPGPNWDPSPKFRPQPRVARVSTLEIAIRAQSKRFLAHPLVVQQLEAIWAGNIVFHSAADNLHREKVIPNQNRGYGAMGLRRPVLQASPDRLQPAKQRDHREPITVTIRRSVTLYDPQDSSLFKLSRLRVPRYRQFLSTCSFAILLGLFLAVLIERSLTITPLEIVFWFWSAGFMLDEVVGFNEQGFSLYIMSFWNAFDLGILLLLICYYCMRLYGILMPDVRKHQVADMAYDLLAANAVLLFPRLFSVLDHYRYFSQLLIAFRMMALDLVAVFILILISCSGFFVAFTLSFGRSFGGNDYDGKAVAYALFQILMGFTPAAWESWAAYNTLGKIILTFFLCICHFLVVTILITVLTNSFMAVVQNANEEHQFVFAVNTISMVKSDALFSYVAPTNVIAWVLTPLRFTLPFREYVKINRTVIKITHFPVLFVIYAYERIILRQASFDATDLVEQRGRARHIETTSGRLHLFSPNQARLREHSVATFHKDRALAEVFRRPFRDNTIRNTQKSHERRKTSNVVNHWMSGMGPDGTASPPLEQDPNVVDHLEARRVAQRRSQLLRGRQLNGNQRNFTTATMSIVSDPADFTTNAGLDSPSLRREEIALPSMSMEDLPQQTDADGDDELVTNDEDEYMTLDRRPTPNHGIRSNATEDNDQQKDYFQQTPKATRKTPTLPALQIRQTKPPLPLTAAKPSRGDPRRNHVRHTSTNTIIHDPGPQLAESSSSPSRKAITLRNSAKNAGSGSGAMTPASGGRNTPKRQLPGVPRPRPIMPPRTAFQSTPNLTGMIPLDPRQKRTSSFALELGSDIGDNKAVGGGFVGAIPSSFATQMAYATGAMRMARAPSVNNDDQQRMSKLMLARFNQLEEGFREVIKEVKDWRKEDIRSADERPVSRAAKTKARKMGKREAKVKGTMEQEESAWVDENDIPQDGRGSSI